MWRFILLSLHSTNRQDNSVTDQQKQPHNIPSWPTHDTSNKGKDEKPLKRHNTLTSVAQIIPEVDVAKHFHQINVFCLTSNKTSEFPDQF